MTDAYVHAYICYKLCFFGVLVCLAMLLRKTRWFLLPYAAVLFVGTQAVLFLWRYAP
jgi:hypothetical protein